MNYTEEEATDDKDDSGEQLVWRVEGKGNRPFLQGGDDVRQAFKGDH